MLICLYICIYSDKISSVTIKSFVDDSPLLVIEKRDLILTAVVTSVAGTNYFTPVTYHWDFGNGDTKASTEPSITYSNYTSGQWNITLKATNNVSRAVFIGRVRVAKG